MSKYLDLPYLRSLNIEPKWFGLGFIQMKISDVRRLHFWHPELAPNPGNAEEVHNHRYDFSSTVLKGKMVDEVWDMIYDPEGDYRMWRVSCKPGEAEAAERIARMGIKQVITRHIKTDGTYYMPQPTFHRSFPDGPTVTMLKRGKVTEDFAYVIRYEDAPHRCPFAVTMEEDDLWGRIAEVLNA